MRWIWGCTVVGAHRACVTRNMSAPAHLSLVSAVEESGVLFHETSIIPQRPHDIGKMTGSRASGTQPDYRKLLSGHERCHWAGGRLTQYSPPCRCCHDGRGGLTVREGRRVLPPP